MTEDNTHIKRVLLWTIIIVSIASFNLWMFMPSIFYKGLAVVFLLSAILIRMDSIIGTKYRVECNLWLGLTINNIVDELFFDPKVVNWNEYLIGTAIITYTFYQLLNNGGRKKQP